ncbi:dynamin family protein, partial [Mycobacterium sp.]|uniref:dynamin family protein n=1 Tax=Mycobacterium sp. TaxID=1785 RepID=UPI003F95B4B2
MSDSPVLAEGVAHPAAPKIDAELYAVIQQTHKALLWGKLNAVADHAWSMLTKAPDMPTVVVIGEVKRGKSSLVNALLGRPDASPVGVDIMTSA